MITNVLLFTKFYKSRSPLILNTGTLKTDIEEQIVCDITPLKTIFNQQLTSLPNRINKKSVRNMEI